MQTIVSLVSAELGVALIPASLTNLRRTGVTYKALRETSPQTEIHLAWRLEDPLPAVKSFVELAADWVAESGRTGKRSTT